MNAKLHLVYASDANYLFPITVAASSAIAQASRPQNLVIHILDCGIPDDKWEAFVRGVYGDGRTAIVRHVIDTSVYADYATWHGSLAPYARLHLPNLLPEVDWCVYADGDTLFTDDPFKVCELFDDAVAIVGHLDTRVRDGTGAAGQAIAAWCGRHGFRQDWGRYVCSGFLLMNLRWLRANGMVARWMAFLGKYPDLPYMDQDTINLCCAGHVALLPDAWGVFCEHAFALKRPGCVHYVTNLPWRKRFSWRVGYFAVLCLWLNAAHELLGIPVCRAAGKTWLRWNAGRLWNRLIGAALPLLLRLPALRRRFPNMRTHFPRRDNRWLMTKKLWQAPLAKNGVK